jgi:signal peptide peptidase SppA
MKYAHIVSEFYGRPWAILESKYHEISAFIKLKAAGGQVSDEEIREYFQAAAKPSAKNVGSVAIIPIYGTIFPRANLMSSFSGGASVQSLMKSFRQAMSDSSVKAIVFDVDSPGGAVDLVDEFATEIFNGGKTKHTVAIANTMAASAAYYLASSCNEISVTPTGSVGSIGVFCEHDDYSKMLEMEGVKVSLIKFGEYKTDGNPYEPLSDSARAELQDMVDTYGAMFIKSVARGRGVSQEKVRNDFGKGRMLLAQDAVKAGMADRVETFEQMLARLGVGGGAEKVAAAAAEESTATSTALASEQPAVPATAEATTDTAVAEEDTALAYQKATRERELELYT